jgi:hypothetical protein
MYAYLLVLMHKIDNKQWEQVGGLVVGGVGGGSCTKCVGRWGARGMCNMGMGIILPEWAPRLIAGPPPGSSCRSGPCSTPEGVLAGTGVV